MSLRTAPARRALPSVVAERTAHVALVAFITRGRCPAFVPVGRGKEGGCTRCSVTPCVSGAGH